MSRNDRLIAKARSNPGTLTFSELVRFVGLFDFVQVRQSGSHRIFRREGHPRFNSRMRTAWPRSRRFGSSWTTPKARVGSRTRGGSSMPGYSQFIAWSSEDGQYVATCPELQHLMALADTEEDAARELKVAIDLVVEDMVDEGNTPPAPFDYSAHSGQFRLRLPRTLHARLAMQAEREGVSLNTLVCMLLSEGSALLHAADHVSAHFKSTYYDVLAGARASERADIVADRANVWSIKFLQARKQTMNTRSTSDLEITDPEVAGCVGGLG